MIRPAPPLHIADEELEELHARLAATRWPRPWPDASWEAGTDLAELRRLAAYWEHGFDWRAVEERIITSLARVRATAAAGAWAFTIGAAALDGVGADNLVMLPYVQGAMAPENNGAASGVLLGLTLQHSRGHVVRAIMESVAYVVRRNVEVMTELEVPVSRVRALGGGSRSAVWKQIEADVLGMPVDTMRHSDAGALGAALLAGVGTGWWPDIKRASVEMVQVKRTYEPNRTNGPLYDDR